MNYTYIMRNTLGLIKIGQSENPETRCKSIEINSGFKTTLEFKIEGGFLEREAHKRLSHFRKEGEWFYCELAIAIKILQEIKAEYDKRLSDNLDQMLKSKNNTNKLDKSKLVGMPLVFLTKTQLEGLKKYMLEKLLEQTDGVVPLSNMLNTHYMTIKGWKDRGQISKKGALLVEDHPTLGRYFKAIDLRPDL